METVMLKIKISITVQGNNIKKIVRQYMINYRLNYIEFIAVGIKKEGPIIVSEVTQEHIVKQTGIWRGRGKQGRSRWMEWQE